MSHENVVRLSGQKIMRRQRKDGISSKCLSLPRDLEKGHQFVKMK